MSKKSKREAAQRCAAYPQPDRRTVKERLVEHQAKLEKNSKIGLNPKKTMKFKPGDIVADEFGHQYRVQKCDLDDGWVSLQSVKSPDRPLWHLPAKDIEKWTLVSEAGRGKVVGYMSFALWPDEAGLCCTNPSADQHGTLGAALAVCRWLERNGFGGDRKVLPKETWTAPVYEEPANGQAIDRSSRGPKPPVVVIDAVKPATTTVKIDRFKPSGKWYEEITLELPVVLPDEKANPKAYVAAMNELHAAIRVEWVKRDDGMIWLQKDERTFPVLHIPGKP